MCSVQLQPWRLHPGARNHPFLPKWKEPWASLSEVDSNPTRFGLSGHTCMSTEATVLQHFQVPVSCLILVPTVLLERTPTWVSIDDSFAPDELGRREADL